MGISGEALVEILLTMGDFITNCLFVSYLYEESFELSKSSSEYRLNYGCFVASLIVISAGLVCNFLLIVISSPRFIIIVDGTLEDDSDTWCKKLPFTFVIAPFMLFYLFVGSIMTGKLESGTLKSGTTTDWKFIPVEFGWSDIWLNKDNNKLCRAVLSLPFGVPHLLMVIGLNWILNWSFLLLIGFLPNVILYGLSMAIPELVFYYHTSNDKLFVYTYTVLILNVFPHCLIQMVYACFNYTQFHVFPNAIQWASFAFIFWRVWVKLALAWMLPANIKMKRFEKAFDLFQIESLDRK
jgi:hypothetical protein